MEMALKNSGPLDYFRIEDQIFEGFSSISQLPFTYRLWQNSLNVPTAKLFSIIKKFVFCLLQTKSTKIVRKLTLKC